MKLARTVLGTNCISVDSESGHRAALSILNEGTGFPGMPGSFEEILNAGFLLVVDFDVTKLNPILGSELHLAARRGATLVTIDSRRTQIARLSQRFLQVRPGSTVLFLAGLAKLILDENLSGCIDCGTAVEGRQEFERSLRAVGLDEVVHETGVSLEDMRATAEQLCRSASAMAFFPSGISGLTEETVRCLFNLFLLAGKVGKPSCGINPVAGLNNLQGAYDMGMAPDLLTGFQPLADSGVRRRFEEAWGSSIPPVPGIPVYERLEDKDPLKLLIVVDHDDGIVRYADHIRRAETVVFIGSFNNPFVEFADIVLPVCSYVETDSTFTNAERRIQLSRKKVEPPPGCPSDWQLLLQIAARFGFDWGHSSSESIMREIAGLTPSYAGVTYDKLIGDGGIQWPCTPEAPAGTRQFLAAEQGAPLRFVAHPTPFPVVKATAGFPFLLMIGKAQHFWHQNNLMKRTFIPLREFNATLLLYPEGFVEICPGDAGALGVRDKSRVRVSSDAGSMEIAVKVSDDVRPKTAYVPYFVRETIDRFLLKHRAEVRIGENTSIPVMIERVQ